MVYLSDLAYYIWSDIPKNDTPPDDVQWCSLRTRIWSLIRALKEVHQKHLEGIHEVVKGLRSSIPSVIDSDFIQVNLFKHITGLQVKFLLITIQKLRKNENLF